MKQNSLRWAKTHFKLNEELANTGLKFGKGVELAQKGSLRMAICRLVSLSNIKKNTLMRHSSIFYGIQTYTNWKSVSYYENMFVAELLKVEDVRTHVCAIFFENLRKICTFEFKQEKQALYWFWHYLTIFFIIFHVFYGILGPFHCAKLSVRKFGCAKELTFRRSAHLGVIKYQGCNMNLFVKEGFTISKLCFS